VSGASSAGANEIRVEPLGEVSRPIVAVLGLGEAGGAIAADLVARDVVTRGFDPQPARTVAGVEQSRSAAEAVATADVVLSVNAQAVAVSVAASIVDELTSEHLYADLNTTSAEVKREVASVLGPSGAAFVDVALLSPVPGKGLRTPCLASGPGAERFALLFGELGMPVETIGGEAGDAATRKLLRSVFMKGLAAAVIESLSAAERAGCEAWLRAQIGSVIEPSLIDRLVDGSKQHARRRIDEMDAAAAVVAELGLEPHVAPAAAEVLRSLAE
jgi:3-hydroxyisobutyrate dehydrogenase-like beta-hydroxyacid dehydrogenase